MAEDEESAGLGHGNGLLLQLDVRKRPWSRTNGHLWLVVIIVPLMRGRKWATVKGEKPNNPLGIFKHYYMSTSTGSSCGFSVCSANVSGESTSRRSTYICFVRYLCNRWQDKGSSLRSRLRSTHSCLSAGGRRSR